MGFRRTDAACKNSRVGECAKSRGALIACQKGTTEKLRTFVAHTPRTGLRGYAIGRP